MSNTVVTVLIIALGVTFLIAGVVNIVGPKGLRSAYVGWGYPAWFHRVSGGLDALTSAMLVFSASRMFGLVLALAICAAAFLTLARHGQWKRTPPSILLAAFVAYLLFASHGG